MAQTGRTLGYIGLGAMGVPMVENLLKAGLQVMVHDKAGTVERTPAGARTAACIAEVVSQCDVVFVCVPDGPASKSVAGEVLAADDRRTSAVINLSTVGIAMAREIGSMFADGGMTYIDAPVSGGRTGAVAGTITLMWGGDGELLGELKGVLESFSGSVFHVGPEPGQGQAVKLLNNFLSATAMAATSEAVAFGERQGIDMKTMLDAVNVSTGRNSASSDKFVNRILPGTYDAGFRMALMAKDVALYMEAVSASGSPDRLGRVMNDIWQAGVANNPDGDFTEIYKLVKGGDELE
jgi:3-hydroxyisobutyrate dehydrogenase